MDRVFAPLTWAIALCLTLNNVFSVGAVVLSRIVGQGDERRVSRQEDEVVDANNFVALGADNLTASGSILNADVDRPRLILGIGFPKCGSEFTWHVLSKAPDVLSGYAKELQYFEWPAGSPKSKCKKLDDKIRSPEEAYSNACFGDDAFTAGKKLLEFSPGYAALRDAQLQETIERVKEVAKGVHLRLIAVVRDPVHRAISELNMFRAYGTTNGTDDELSLRVQEHLKHDTGHEMRYHIASGEYMQRLQPWLDAFPKESLLVVNNAALNNVDTWQRIFAHSGLDMPSNEWFEEKIGQVAKNERIHESNYLQLTEQALTELRQYYSAKNNDFWDLLGVTPWW